MLVQESVIIILCVLRNINALYIDCLNSKKCK